MATGSSSETSTLPSDPSGAQCEKPEGDSLPQERCCLSVVIPAYNEEKTLETVVHEVLKLPQVLEVIIVDDGSTDATPRICERLSGLPRSAPSVCRGIVESARP